MPRTEHTPASVGLMLPAARKCKTCKKVFVGQDRVGNCFGIDVRGGRGQPGLKPTCRKCESILAIANRRARPQRRKAWASLTNHARRLGKMSTDRFRQLYGWTVDIIEGALVDAWRNNLCPYCGNAIHGPGQDETYGLMHVDVMNPSQPPFWGGNTRIVCAPCNNRKGDLDLADFLANEFLTDHFNPARTDMRPLHMHLVGAEPQGSLFSARERTLDDLTEEEKMAALPLFRDKGAYR